ncbi:hypothetical protein [Candidatus Williamhamiltonella defendens]|uniref:hypothetical protein n=1 Tax=Candidatus Williamhamiltonella defendens TaxID=138072 RepID=UPI00130D931E|nr:hypothetical protein [Candidatus Hamiltonella defensa]
MAAVAERLLKPLGIFGARYAHMPAVGDLYVLMRLIKEDGEDVPDFESFGFLPDQIRVLKRLLHRLEGMIILSGHLREIQYARHRLRRLSCAMGLYQQVLVRRLLTIEYPPEGRIDGEIQSKIISDKKNTKEIKRA